MSKSKLVTITVNGAERQVPQRTSNEEETLAALGLSAGTRVAYAYARECWLDFSCGWGFAAGHDYVSEGHDPDESTDARPWVRDADWWQAGAASDD